jgi:hypothetical protein
VPILRSLPTIFARRKVELLLFAFLWLPYAYFYQSSQHNEAARFDQARAILDRGVLWIDEYAGYNTADVVRITRGGATHIYPNKAPGTSFLGVAPFWFWMHALRPLGLAEHVYWHAVAYLTTLFTVSLLSALAAVAMYSVLRRLKGDSFFAMLAVVAVWLGTICFPFSTLFFSHQQAAAQLVLAFWLLFHFRSLGPCGRSRPAEVVQVGNLSSRPTGGEPDEGASPGDRHDAHKGLGYGDFIRLAAAGFLCGFSIATEYPTALLVLLLCAYCGATLVRLDSPGRVRIGLGCAFAAGLALGLAPLIGYNVAVFGNPLSVPYEQYAREGAAASFPGHSAGFVGVYWPGWSQFVAVLKEITIRPQRGLLYIGHEGWRVYATNPVLWLALPGIVWLSLRRSTRVEAALVTAMAVAYLTFNACYGDSIVYWGGAWSVGPRHLVPLIPFLAIPLCEGARHLWFLFAPLLLVSIFYMLLATAVEPRVPYEYPNPARDLFLQKYLQGQFGLNRQGLFDPLHRPLVGDSTAFNLGGWMGLPQTMELMPLLLFWLIAGIALLFASCKEVGQVGDLSEVEQVGNLSSEPPQENLEKEKTHRLPTRATFWNRLPVCASSWIGAFVWVAFLTAVAVAPAVHARRLERDLATGGGLLGRYYPTPDWSGAPAFIRKDRLLDFNWTLDPPLIGRFSVEWKGTIRIDRPGRYVFATTSDDGSFLGLGEKAVVDNGGRHPPRYKAGQVEIRKAGTFPITIRYVNEEGGGMLRVTWQPPGQVGETLLPSEVLAPPR